MAITFRDFAQRKYLRKLELVAGAGGLDRHIVIANILDYEFSLDSEIINPFEHEGIVISSLLFAKGHPEYILPAVKKLLALDVSGMAYEAAIFDKLPREVIEFADENDFPIFKFEREVMMENIIFEIMDAVQSEDAFILSDDRVNKVISGELMRSEIAAIEKGLSLDFREYTVAAYVCETEQDASLQPEKVFKNFYLYKTLREKHILFKYKEGFFILTTLDSKEESKFKIAINDALEILDVPKEKVSISCSDVHKSSNELDLCIRESYYGSLVAQIEDIAVTNYSQMGTYKMLIPLADDFRAGRYADEFLMPIIDKGEMFDTAIEYVLCKGDLHRVAEKKICHPNTIRYRMSRVKEMTSDSSKSEYEFYEELAVAVKLYLLRKNER